MGVTAEQMVEFFNSLLKFDHGAIHHVFTARFACNEALANHPSVVTVPGWDGSWVGSLGVLNGLLASCGQPRLAIQTDEDGGLVGFQLYGGDDGSDH